MLASSDTFDNVAGLIGPQWTNSDNVTFIRQPAFNGTGEANAKVRVLAGGVVIGEGVVNTDGTWEVTVEPLKYGQFVIQTEVEDRTTLLAVAQRLGYLKVPADLAVAGYADAPPARFSAPPLTMAGFAEGDIGLEAGNMLLRLIAGGRVSPRRRRAAPELRVRQSCGCG